MWTEAEETEDPHSQTQEETSQEPAQEVVLRTHRRGGRGVLNAVPSRRLRRRMPLPAGSWDRRVNRERRVDNDENGTPQIGSRAR